MDAPHFDWIISYRSTRSAVWLINDRLANSYNWSRALARTYCTGLFKEIVLHSWIIADRWKREENKQYKTGNENVARIGCTRDDARVIGAVKIEEKSLRLHQHFGRLSLETLLVHRSWLIWETPRHGRKGKSAGKSIWASQATGKWEKHEMETNHIYLRSTCTVDRGCVHMGPCVTHEW